MQQCQTALLWESLCGHLSKLCPWPFALFLRWANSIAAPWQAWFSASFGTPEGCVIATWLQTECQDDGRNLYSASLFCSAVPCCDCPYSLGSKKLDVSATHFTACNRYPVASFFVSGFAVVGCFTLASRWTLTCLQWSQYSQSIYHHSQAAFLLLVFRVFSLLLSCPQIYCPNRAHE